MQVSPAGAGSTDPPGGEYWYNAGSTVTITATQTQVTGSATGPASAQVCGESAENVLKGCGEVVGYMGGLEEGFRVVAGRLYASLHCC